MESGAKVMGHPIHPILVPFPIGLLTTAVIFDVVHLITGGARWAEIQVVGVASLLILPVRRLGVSVTMDQFPLVAFATEHLGYTQVHRNGFRAPAHSSVCPLKTDPIGETFASRHVKDLEVTIATGFEDRGVMFIFREHIIRTLTVASL